MQGYYMVIMDILYGQSELSDQCSSFNLTKPLLFLQKLV